MKQYRNRYISFVLVFIVTACNSQKDHPTDNIKAVLASNYPSEKYKLLELSIKDSLVTADFIDQLTRDAQNWKAANKELNDRCYQEAMDFYGADHVKHLHKQRLTIEDYMDSLELIQDHLMSFSNQDEFDAEYLKEYYSLHHRLEALESEEGEILWYTVNHRYLMDQADSKEIKVEKLYYFPRDSFTIPYDPTLDDQMIYTIYHFRMAGPL